MNNFRLTEEILKWLHNYLSKLHEFTSGHRSLHEKLEKFLQWRGCRLYAEFADKTLDILLELLKQKAFQFPSGTTAASLAYGIAAMLLLECFRRQKNRVDLPHDPMDEGPSEEDRLSDDENHYALMREALSKLEPKQRELLEHYYKEAVTAEDRKKLAVEVSTSDVGLRLKVHKLRKELRQSFISLKKKKK